MTTLEAKRAEAYGAVAEALLEAWCQHRGRPSIQVVAWVQSIGEQTAGGPPPHGITTLPWTRAEVDAAPLRCPDTAVASTMATAVEAARARHDSLGGVVRCVATGLPAGWGDPVFDKLTELLGHALHSLPAVRGVQFGSGFAAARMTGAQHNDPWLGPGLTASNHHGGTLGGLSTGMPLVLDVAFKPASTIARNMARTCPSSGWLKSQATTRAPRRKNRHPIGHWEGKSRSIVPPSPSWRPCPRWGRRWRGASSPVGPIIGWRTSTG